MDFLSFNWGFLVFIYLLIIVELVDIKVLNKACDILKEFSRNPKSLSSEDKSSLVWVLVKGFFLTLAVVAGALCIVFFIINHL